MLSDTAYPVIQATLPVVGENIQEIASRFYQHMFQEHPELLNGLFNRGNQADGRQQQALAGSIAAFAGFLVNDPTHLPDHLLSRIAHKHVSLGLSPEQYQVVHDNLMWAIVDVLGGAVTPDVAAAWDEVYWLMANMLINKERGLYDAVRLGPDTIWRTWRVAEKTRETDDVVSFVVERTDEREVKPSLPGQYVTIRMQMTDGVLQPRQYSLTQGTTGSTGGSPSSASAARGRPPARCPPCCTTTSAWAMRSPCPPLSATLSSNTPTARWCWQAPASALRRWPACCPTWSSPDRSAKSCSFTPTTPRPPLHCGTR
ncbi:globin domain-containing protein [Paenarthrobacter sp. 22069]|uniref:globin domain-containing protein n=1 Tax=Paenarthrobacter sp. 22069 TaxID=3453864 RepID=UPI003F85B5EE